MDNTQTEFDAAYWAAQHPEVRALPGMEFGERVIEAQVLATKGFTIDVPIMAWGWDPYLVMKMRSDYGYTWVPSALQPAVAMAPGLSNTLAQPYDPTHPPAGSIPVSLNLADYPSFPVAPSSTAIPVEDPVGLQSVGTLYLSVVGENFANGAKYSDARGTFLKHVVITAFGRTMYWEKIG